jgi:hypothetical protein
LLTPDQERQLFESLGRDARFKDWLKQELDSVTKILVSAVEVDVLRKAQGQAQFIVKLQKRLDAGR